MPPRKRKTQEKAPPVRTPKPRKVAPKIVRVSRKKLEPLILQTGDYLANFTIGFTLLRISGNEEDAIPAGTGTLVSIDGIDGILTAGHVAKELPDDGLLGIISFRRPSVIQKYTIEMKYTDRLILWNGNKANREGPDLGFVRLPLKMVGDFKARHSFFNLSKRQVGILRRNRKRRSGFEGISGLIAEWTTTIDDNVKVRRKRFKALFGVGIVRRRYHRQGYDLSDFEVTYNPTSPSDYRGMSGGGLWRAYIEKSGKETVVKERVFYGVAFFQKPISKKKGIIICHGRKSVYGKLIDAFRERWGQRKD